MFTYLLTHVIEIYDNRGQTLKDVKRGRLYKTSGVDVEYGYVYASGLYCIIEPTEVVEIHDIIVVDGEEKYRVVKIDKHEDSSGLHHITLQLDEVRGH